MNCRTVLLSLLSFIPALGLTAGAATAPVRDQATASPTYDAAFWQHWGDGQAEVAGYDLSIPRYGALRSGTAVAIFVTEPFSAGERVKADRPVSDRFEALKLNLMRDFPTGVYDYNLMTSVFVALSPVAGYPAGAPTKVSFGAQEWCGHAYQQLRFDAGAVRHTQHSYFQGEADRETSLPLPPASAAAAAAVTSEDALPLWARGLATPRLAAGESASVKLVSSLAQSRLSHRPVAWLDAELSRLPGTRPLTVPAGSFEVELALAEVAPGSDDARTWTFYVEAEPPHRLIAWQSTNGERAELLGATRMKYWQLHDLGDEAALARLGLLPRPARTP